MNSIFFFRLIICCIFVQSVVSIQIKKRKIEEEHPLCNGTLYNYVEIENITEKHLDELTVEDLFSFSKSNIYNFFVYFMNFSLYVKEIIELFVSMYTFKFVCTSIVLLFSMYKLYYNVKINFSK